VPRPRRCSETDPDRGHDQPPRLVAFVGAAEFSAGSSSDNRSPRIGGIRSSVGRTTGRVGRHNQFPGAAAREGHVRRGLTGRFLLTHQRARGAGDLRATPAGGVLHPPKSIGRWGFKKTGRMRTKKIHLPAGSFFGRGVSCAGTNQIGDRRNKSTIPRKNVRKTRWNLGQNIKAGFSAAKGKSIWKKITGRADDPEP